MLEQARVPTPGKTIRRRPPARRARDGPARLQRDWKSSGTVVTPPPRFKRPSAFLRIRSKAVDTQPKIRAEACAFRVIAPKHVLLERVGEELLREIGRFIRVEAPLESQVFVDRLPIRLDQRSNRQPAGLLIVAARARHDREPRRRKVHGDTLAHVSMNPLDPPRPSSPCPPDLTHPPQESGTPPHTIVCRPRRQHGDDAYSSPRSARRRARDRCRVWNGTTDRRTARTASARAADRHRSLVEHAADGTRKSAADVRRSRLTFVQRRAAAGCPSTRGPTWSSAPPRSIGCAIMTRLFAEILSSLRPGGRLFAQCGGGPNLAGRTHWPRR